MRPASFAQSSTRALSALGLAGLAALTLVDEGATRMFSSPWRSVFWFVHFAPAAALCVRAAFDSRPLALPVAAWRWLLGLLAVIVIAAALASPFRAQSLRAAATPLAALAVFFLLFDWLHENPAAGGTRREQLERALGWFFVAIIFDSLGLWLFADAIPGLLSGSLHDLFNLRNGHPLGHSNYTAGLAVFMLPWLGARAVRTRGPARAGWTAVALLALFMLFTSGSRGGVLGLAALLALLLVLGWRSGRLRARHAIILAVTALVFSAGFALINPRIRGLLAQEAAPGPPDESAVQRSAMLAAGLHMGADRPLAGFGPGVTPLVYPRYRARLDGGVETALQLHCTPLQIWADLGGAGLACCLALAALVAGAWWKQRIPTAAGLALGGYGAFVLTDFQFDVPVFAFLAMTGLAVCAPPATAGAGPRGRRALALGILFATALVAMLGRSDPSPLLNVEALAIGRDPAQTSRAIALLRQSLSLNPEQGIAQFNLGWLLVVRDPPAAERHFLAAARLWPDKDGVYFGLGLARMNQDRPAEAVQAFALECVNHPAFAASPWWRVTALASLRAPTAARVAAIYRQLAPRLAAGRWPGSEVRYAAALNAWLAGSLPGREVAGVATTRPRRDFFRSDPPPAGLIAAPVRILRYQELGYPVIMRDSDLPPPVDLFDDRENALAAGRLSFLFPAKGWLPSPLLLEFLDNPAPSKR